MALRALRRISAGVRPNLLGISKSFFSTDTLEEDPNFLCSYKAYQKLRDLHTSTPDFQRCDGPAKSPELDIMIQKAKDAASERLKLKNLKQVYEKLVRPELLSRLLIHGYSIDDNSTQWLSYQTHAKMKKVPRFTSSYDVMVRLTELPKSAWVHFLNYLGEERIIVLDGHWASISTVIHMLYQPAPQDINGIHFPKGEADASWYEVTKTADLAFIIWDSEKILDAQTYLGVSDCRTVDISEAKAALAVLMRAEELSVPNFLLWTDNATVGDTLTGKRHVSEDEKDSALLMALKSKRASFERLVMTRVPRQLLSFADGMLRDSHVQLAKNSEIMYPRYHKQSADKWSYELNGLPIFDLLMTADAKSKIKKFGM